MSVRIQTNPISSDRFGHIKPSVELWLTDSREQGLATQSAPPVTAVSRRQLSFLEWNWDRELGLSSVGRRKTGLCVLAFFSSKT